MIAVTDEGWVGGEGSGRGEWQGPPSIVPDQCEFVSIAIETGATLGRHAFISAPGSPLAIRGQINPPGCGEGVAHLCASGALWRLVEPEPVRESPGLRRGEERGKVSTTACHRQTDDTSTGLHAGDLAFSHVPRDTPEAQFHFPAVTEKGRRSCLLMAPGACGSRLVNQCESTSGRHPPGGSARLHIGETFPKAFPVLLASQQAVTFLPSCVFHKHTRGPKGSGGRRCPFVDMLDWGLGGGRTRSGGDQFNSTLIAPRWGEGGMRRRRRRRRSREWTEDGALAGSLSVSIHPPEPFYQSPVGTVSQSGQACPLLCPCTG
ncbi:unnamed protein product [Pleuronectes platessa]|uniref:Uncharacterized protein n=1 Tax=Pleuronectes platessa TaxID=8262 RepID=A0A9N7YTK8_PLEPL|nr:unnamed protein product [Pleuronectes platessa]